MKPLGTWVWAAACLLPLFAAPEPAAAGNILQGLPVYFEPNRGQFDSRVRFLARGASYQAWITDSELVLAFTRRGPAVQAAAGHKPEPPPIVGREVVRIGFGSRPPRTAKGLDKLESYSNYFIGNDDSKWRTDISHYSRALLEEVYPGIDMVFYGKGSTIEYDFIVKPGADPSLISLTFKGPAAPALTARGDLSIALARGAFLHKAPVVFQKDRILTAPPA